MPEKKIQEHENSNRDQEKSEARKFIWKRVYTRLLLYLAAILIIIILMNRPV